MQEMQVQSLGQKDPLEKEIVTNSSILAWEIPAAEELHGLQSMGSQRVGHNLATKQYAQVLKFIQFSSVAQSCPTLCDPMNRSTPDLPVHHQIPEFTQTHVHRLGDATHPSHPLSSPFPPAPNPSKHQSLFQ